MAEEDAETAAFRADARALAAILQARRYIGAEIAAPRAGGEQLDDDAVFLNEEAELAYFAALRAWSARLEVKTAALEAETAALRARRAHVLAEEDENRTTLAQQQRAREEAAELRAIA